MRIGILGATGPQGRGLAGRLAVAGHRVIIGSRSAEKAAGVVDGLREEWGERVANLEPAVNVEAAGQAEVVVVSVPWDAAVSTAADLAPQLAGKVVISMANALRKTTNGFEAIVPPEGSVAAGVAKAAPEAKVVAAYQHVAAKELGDLDHPVEGDVLVCSDDRDAAALVCGLTEQIPDLVPFDAGDLENAIGIEAFTAVMLSVNVRYRTRTGLRLTGIPRP